MATSMIQDVIAPSPTPESNADAVCVAVHIRPLVDAELAQGCQPCLTVTPGQPQVGNMKGKNFPKLSANVPFRPSETYEHHFMPYAMVSTEQSSCQGNLLFRQTSTVIGIIAVSVQWQRPACCTLSQTELYTCR